MAIGLFKRLFGAGAGQEAAPAQAEEYKGFTIVAEPRPQGGQFLTAGRIAKDTADGRKEHEFVRAETHASRDEARNFTILKAQRLIDEQGERLFR